MIRKRSTAPGYLTVWYQQKRNSIDEVAENTRVGIPRSSGVERAIERKFEMQTFLGYAQNSLGFRGPHSYLDGVDGLDE